MPSITNYVLVDGVPAVEPNPMRWAKWIESSTDRFIARTKIGDIEVSTVFLGIDHNILGGDPLLFETMCFYDGSSITCDRCGGTAIDAKAMHDRVCARVHAGSIQPWGEEDA